MRIGIDLGGTKIEGIALDDSGREIARRRVPTPQGAYDDTVAAIRDMVAALDADAGARCTVGVATPGAISPATGLIKNANSTRLNGHPLDRDLAAALGREARLANDANCFAVSEAVDGAAAGAHVVFGVIIGTGVGGGIAIDGRAMTGAQAIAGEWGHNPLPAPFDDERPGRLCYCGRAGCLETWLSGPGLSAQYRALTGEDVPAVAIAAAAAAYAARGGGGDRNDDSRIVAATVSWVGADGGTRGPTTDRGGVDGGPAVDGRIAATLLERYAHRLARALGGVVNLLDPDVIVLGGGLSNVASLYRRVPELWGPFVFTEAGRIRTRLAAPLHGDSSGVRGAAWLWPPVRR